MVKKKAVIMTLVWIGIIFYFSHQPANVSNKQSGVIVDSIRFVVDRVVEDRDFSLNFLTKLVRKTAHFSIYGVLGMLMYISVYIDEMNEKIRDRAFLISVLLCFLYALSDEFHQMHVAGRSGQFSDVMLDSCGALFGTVFSKNVLNRFILNGFNAKI